LNQYFSIDGHPLDNDLAVAQRQQLVEQFNAVIGAPGPVISAMQQDFVSGRMPYDEIVSYVRYCKFMIHEGTQHGDGASA
jgi:hypothetical protein